jgi:hypothetical protein
VPATPTRTPAATPTQTPTATPSATSTPGNRVYLPLILRSS